MKLHLSTFTVQNYPALKNSCEPTPNPRNLFLRLEHGDIEGWGEASPFSIGDSSQTLDAIARSLQRIAPLLESYSPLERQKIDRVLKDHALPSAARSALDMAIQDWIGKAINLPLYLVFGLDPDHISPTTLTIDAASPEDAETFTQSCLKTGPDLQGLSVKLGSTTGLETDKSIITIIQKTTPQIKSIGVDVQGKWTLRDAIKMSEWLHDRGITYLQQPLPKGHESDLIKLYYGSPLPIFVSESCFTSHDIPALSDRVHGITIRLNTCGGITESIRMIHTARSHGLKIMLSGESGSTLTNTAIAHLSPLVDQINLNHPSTFKADPFVGATLHSGGLIPNDRPGLGVSLKSLMSKKDRRDSR